MQWTSITTKSMFGNYSGALFLSFAFEFWKWSTRFISALFTPSPNIHAVNASDPYETCRSHPIGWMATADRDTDEKERCRSGERKRRAKRWKMFLSLKRVHETRQKRFLRWRSCGQYGIILSSCHRVQWIHQTHKIIAKLNENRALSGLRVDVHIAFISRNHSHTSFDP